MKVLVCDLKPDIVLAFSGGKGTDNCVKQALSRNIPVHLQEKANVTG